MIQSQSTSSALSSSRPTVRKTLAELAGTAVDALVEGDLRKGKGNENTRTALVCGQTAFGPRGGPGIAINYDRRRFLRAAAMTIAASRLSLTSSAAVSLFSEGSLPSLDGAAGWLNSRPLKRANLRGKVTLIDFWTYPASTGDARFPMCGHGTRNTESMGLS